MQVSEMPSPQHDPYHCCRKNQQTQRDRRCKADRPALPAQTRHPARDEARDDATDRERREQQTGRDRATAFHAGARPDRNRAPSALRLTKRLVPEGIKGTGAWCKHATAPSPRPVAPRFCTAPASSTPCNHQGSARSTRSCPRFTGHSSGGCCVSCDKLAWRAHLQP